MILLRALAPLRRKNLAALDMVRLVHFVNGACTILIGREETKTGTSLEFKVPGLLLPYLDEYLRLVRPRLNSDARCTALWVGAKGGALSYAAIQGIFARHSTQRSARGQGRGRPPPGPSSRPSKSASRRSCWRTRTRELPRCITIGRGGLRRAVDFSRRSQTFELPAGHNFLR